MSSLRPSSAVSQITGAPAASTTETSSCGVDLAGAEVGVPVGTGACRVPRVVAVHQVDASGQGPDPVNRIDQGLTGGPGVTGVQAEANSLVADVIPQFANGVEIAGHRVIAARGVFQIHRHVCFQVVQRFDPPLETGFHIVVVGVAAVHDDGRRADLRGRIAGVLQDLARRDPDAVVRRCDVDKVRRMNVKRHGRRFERLGIVAGFRLLPALWVAEEELHHVGAVGLRGGQRVVIADV